MRTLYSAMLLSLLLFYGMMFWASINLLEKADLEVDKEKQLSNAEIACVAQKPASTKTSFPAVHCPTFFAAAKAGQLGLQDPNHGLDPASYTRLTAEEPQFNIALHNQVFDPVRWFIMIKGGYYEKTLVKIWREVLLANYDDNNDDETIVLDVGGNIGFFSLLSMSLSKWMKQRLRVHTFEPNPANLIRICESLQLNDWQHPLAEEYTKHQNASIMVHPIGVSDKNDVLSFVAQHAKPGSGTFIRSNEAKKGGTSDITVVKLDDFARQRGWLDISASSSSRPNIAILKIDVEGLEPDVVLGAKELIRSRVVRNIFMELTVTNDSQAEACAQALAVIVNAKYQLKQTGRSLGPGNKNTWPNDEHLISKIVAETRNDRTKQLNLWWTL